MKIFSGLRGYQDKKFFQSGQANLLFVKQIPNFARLQRLQEIFSN